MDVLPRCLQMWALGKRPAQGQTVWSKVHPISRRPDLAGCIDTTLISVGDTGAPGPWLQLLTRSLLDVGPQLPHLENGSVIYPGSLNFCFQVKGDCCV